MKPVVPTLPARAPRTNGNAFTRWIGRCVLRLGGWQMCGQWPDVDKVVVIVAPHSSAWDAIWAIAAKVAMGLEIVFIGKKEAFWGPVGWLLRTFGGVPVDRSSPAGVVGQVAKRLRDSERMWFALAPEGTRKEVTQWKSGFWKIAKAANVPVFCIWFHYPDKTMGLGPLIELSDDMNTDIARIRQLFAGRVGKHRGA